MGDPAPQPVTLREADGLPLAAPTLLESNVTLIEGAPAQVPHRPHEGLVPTSGLEWEGFRLLDPIQRSSAEADLWKLEDLETGARGVLKLYRFGILPKQEIQEKIRALDHPGILKTWKTGRTGERAFEILEWMPEGSMADHLLAGSAFEWDFRTIVRQLSASIGALHQADVIHRDIKPSNILLRQTQPLQLVLTDFGISSVMDLSLHLSNTNRTAAYAAPEAMTGVVARASDWWSLGVLLLEWLTRKHPFAGLDERAINFTLATRGMVVPEGLPEGTTPLIQGLLTRDHSRRWGGKQVSAWLENQQDIPVYYVSESQGMDGLASKPYRFEGRDYQHPETLANAMAQRWEASLARFQEDGVLRWIEDALGNADLGHSLQEIRKDPNLDAEMRLSASLMAMNPELPPVFRGEVVTPDWLTAHVETLYVPDWQPAKTEAESRPDDPRLLERCVLWLQDQRQVTPNALVRHLQISNSTAEALIEELTRRRILEEPGAVIARKIRIAPTRAFSLAAALLNSSLPQWVERLKGEAWMRETSERRARHWDLVESLQVPVDPLRLEMLLLTTNPDWAVSLAEERKQRFVDSNHPKLRALLQKATLSAEDQILVAAGLDSCWITAAQRRIQEAQEFLAGLEIDWDVEAANRLAEAESDALIDQAWEKRQNQAARYRNAALEAWRTIPDIGRMEKLALATAGPEEWLSHEEYWLEQAKVWGDRLRNLRRAIQKSSQIWWVLSPDRARGLARELQELFQDTTDGLHDFLEQGEELAAKPEENLQISSIRALRGHLQTRVIELNLATTKEQARLIRLPWLGISILLGSGLFLEWLWWSMF